MSRERDSQDVNTLVQAEKIAENKVIPIKKTLKKNNILTGVSVSTVAGFLVWCMAQLVTVKSSNAQTSLETKANTTTLVQHDTRLGTLERTSIRSEAMNEMIVVRLGMIPPPKLKSDGGVQ